ncbi:MAG: hypothetical protein HN692_00485 [Candidatus Cloacimonetes bacterium]|nr:hypothetical protein [Candidatus Cloacimonadota bacterium]
MKDIYKISNNQHPLILPILQAVSSVTKQFDNDFIVIGATARDFLINYVYDAKLKYRATKDFDLAIMVESWDKYNQIMAELILNHNFTKSEISHRLFFNSLPVDIIPFGKISKKNSIFWPPKGEVKMNIIGFDEVYKTSVLCSLGETKFRIACLEGFCVLKIVAWQDRKAETTKDAEDLGLILYHYHDLIPDDLFENYEYLIDTPQYDYLIAGIKILGKRVRKFIGNSVDLKNQICLILENELIDEDNSKLVFQLNKNEKYEFNYKILKTFWKELEI